MTVVEQEIYAVLLELDGERFVFGNFLQHLDFRDAHLEAARSALFGANFAGDNHAGLLREAFQGFESFGIFFQGADTLDDAGAVAKNRKNQLAGFTDVVKPTADGDFLAVVIAGVFNRNRSHSELLR